MNEQNQIIAVLILRVFFGILIFMQGYDKVFRLGINRVVETFEYPLKSIHHLPEFLLVAGVFFTSYVELLGGFFLIIGFMKHFMLYLMGFDLIIAAIGFGIMNPMWDMKHVFPRFMLLIALLIMPSQWDVISLDHVVAIFKIMN